MQDTLTIQYQNLATLAFPVVVTGNTRQSWDYSLDASATAREIDIPLVRSAVQVLLMVADVDCTVKTNSSGAPDDTKTLKANVPLLCALGALGFVGMQTAAAVFPTADITKIFVINTSSPLAAGTFRIRAIIT